MADMLDDLRDRLLRIAGGPLQPQQVDHLVADLRHTWGGDRVDIRKGMQPRDPRMAQQRAAQVTACLQRGLTPWQIATETGIPRATVYRVIGRHKR